MHIRVTRAYACYPGYACVTQASWAWQTLVSMVISKNLVIACVLTMNIEHVPVPSTECPYVFACLVMSLAGGVVASAALRVSLSI